MATILVIRVLVKKGLRGNSATLSRNSIIAEPNVPRKVRFFNV